MTGKLSKNFHGVGIGSLSKILAVNVKAIGRVTKLYLGYFDSYFRSLLQKIFHPFVEKSGQ